MNTKKVSAETRQEWKASNSRLEASYVPVPGSKPHIQPEEEYEVITLQRNDGTGSFNLVEFSLEGDPTKYAFDIKNKKAGINDALPVKIAKFVASKDHLCTNGTTLLAGTVKWFAYQ